MGFLRRAIYIEDGIGHTVDFFGGGIGGHVFMAAKKVNCHAPLMVALMTMMMNCDAVTT